MTRTLKRGYIEKGWWNSLTNKWIENEYSIIITKVRQIDDYGKWEDDDEDEIIRYGGYTTIEDAMKDLKEYKVKEIIK